MKHTLLACALLISATAAATPTTKVTTTPIITGTNYLSPYCGCCKEWVTHMKDNGFELENVYQENLTPTKIKLGVLPEYASCHTAQIEGYTFEGHIPAADIKRFLASKPTRMKGLAVGGMPMGSPGMEYGDQKDRYNVVAFDDKGRTMVWASHN
ncbi:DUF411 domain-containing protein [Photobacterium toruni]|uniref:DUF411 domain-containing protein n=1 Tax=Photobacterium toruni TaxID=1935446 RepID=A0ABU6L5R1_9GAMM|nr:DUF411 domain-containing protein [Photobacterium toruni]MEC6814358.1 DUF411 domain-containing protein [Photobacterium toruni]MEC6831347.1 DUF411 domain-containing protein [Photobacterium toruni]